MKRRLDKHLMDEYFFSLRLIQWKVIRAYFGDLKANRAGRIYLQCPFHGEITPSFVFNVKKGMCFCFGCGFGGNMFSFLGRMEGLKGGALMFFIEKKYGVPMPHRLARKLESRNGGNRFRKQETKLNKEQRFLRKINKLIWIASQIEDSGLSYGCEADHVVNLFYQ